MIPARFDDRYERPDDDERADAAYDARREEGERRGRGFVDYQGSVDEDRGVLAIARTVDLSGGGR